MHRRSLFSAAAGMLSGQFAGSAFGQVVQPQAALTCAAEFFDRPTVGEFAADDDLTAKFVKNLNDEAVIQSQMLRLRQGNFQALGPGLNVILTYGQSNAFGTQAHPALALPPALDSDRVWMLGGSHRGRLEPEDDGINPVDPSLRRHIPFSDVNFSENELYRLRSTVLDTRRTRVLSYAEGAELSIRPPCDRIPPRPPSQTDCTDSNGGETIGIAFAAYLRSRIVAVRGVNGGDLLLVDCSQADQTLAALKDNYFGRIPSAFSKIVSAAARKGMPVVRHVATLFVQGSGDYAENTSDTIYFNRLNDLFTVIDEAAFTAFGSAQSRPAVGIIMQTSGRGVTGASRYSLSISMAQRRLAAARKYPISQEVGAEHSIHFTNSGARMAGLAAARGAEDVLLGNRSHIDIAPIEPRPNVMIVSVRGATREVLIPFTSPGPLCFRPIIQGTIPESIFEVRERLRLQMIVDPRGVKTFGIIAYDDTKRNPTTGAITGTLELAKVFWVSGVDRVLACAPFGLGQVL